ncbi:hypothetical protein GPECTOR_32g478 [Gonium pectorale]|uniref:DNA-directed DNA polymerase family A palm domain-containing protein n=1 Tax=Gonium pectorale TaxID=33097 RepID=A0A150GE57_GONPE|nr:hypothetical protein GPECTOR_32g478 [Gonium pectorale]|eukprot:KXZ47865.1 hypothetical protein GPECTOR_32g478 [Gonium pectorale]
MELPRPAKMVAAEAEVEGAAGGGQEVAPTRANKRVGKGTAEAAAKALRTQLAPLCEAVDNGGGSGSGAAAGGVVARFRDVTSPQLVAELRSAVSRSRLLLLGLLVAVCEGPVCQYISNTQEAMSLGWRCPPPGGLRLLDPCVLGWMESPQLAQRDEKEIDVYNLETLCPRFGIRLLQADAGAAAGTAAAPGPLARLRLGLLATAALFEAVRQHVEPWLPPEAVQVEMQVIAVLARMESLGIAVDAAGLDAKAAVVRSRMEALAAAAAAALGGRAVNLGSSAQLAVVLYEELGLPPPGSAGQQGHGHEAGAGKDRHGRPRTHLTTDEAALKQIAHLHPLPGLVLQYRSLQNVLSKWLEPEWLPPLLERSRAARAASVAAPPAPGPQQRQQGQLGANGLQLPRLACSWNQTATATGRLSSSAPNMQAVTKYEVVVQLQPQQADGDADAEGADYSQVELRLLAHLSGDLRLQELLRRQEGDAFRHIAASWLRPGTSPADVSNRDREQAKRVIYGIIYGMTPQGLAAQLAEHGLGLEEAAALRASFLRHFAGVQSFITSSLHHARRHGYVTTGLLHRRRPIAGLTSADARVRSEAERKVVNSIVQGSAADLVKCAMCVWASYSHPDTTATATAAAALQPPPKVASDGPLQLPPWQQLCAEPVAASAAGKGSGPAELVAQIHDELLFECDADAAALRRLVVAVRGIMCGVASLDVPLLVKVASGPSWGALKGRAIA